MIFFIINVPIAGLFQRQCIHWSWKISLTLNTEMFNDSGMAKRSKVKNYIKKKRFWFKSSFFTVLLLFVGFLSLALWQYGWEQARQMIIGYGLGITAITLIAMLVVGRKQLFKWFR